MGKIATLVIHGSDKILVPFGNTGTFIIGKRVKIKVIGLSDDKDTPVIVRQALVGKEAEIVLTSRQIEEHGDFSSVPDDSVLAYAKEIIDLLIEAGEKEAAEALKGVAPSDFDMYVFEPGVFKIIKEG